MIQPQSQKNNSRAKQFLLDTCSTFKKNNAEEKKIKVPTSCLYSKLEIPIYYSNVITIEDMKFENSNYYVSTNGFLTSNVSLKSMKHTKMFTFQDCIFRIFPKTYNINKYKILDSIKNKDAKINKKELNFKFVSELFNNLDIVETKKGEPVKYGDIVILMHENSQKFLKFDNDAKKLVLSNHDSEYSLFQIDQHSEIMINDDQILKSGQPIKLKVASFEEANKNLYLSLTFPLNKQIKKDKPKTSLIDLPSSRSKRSTVQLQIPKTYSNDHIFNIEEFNDLEDNSQNPINDSFEEKQLLQDDSNNFDKANKKYKLKPNLVFEEYSNMRWRFNVYSTFTLDDTILCFGDYISILHYQSTGYLTVDQIEERKKRKMRCQMQYSTKSLNSSLSSNNNKNDDDDSEISNQNFYNFNDMFEHKEELINQKFEIKSKFFVKNYSDPSSMKVDANTCWVIEGIFPQMKQICFIRYYDESKLDAHRMTFRLRNIKTKKFLTIRRFEINSDEYEEHKHNQEYDFNIQEEGEELYKFTLVDGEITNDNYEIIIQTEEYQNSLFGFIPSIKISGKSGRAEKNQFLRIYHIATKKFLKLTYLAKQRDDDLLNTILTLVPFEDEQEIFKIMTVETEQIWNYKFLNNLYFLMKSLINTLSKNSISPPRQKRIAFEQDQNSNKKIKYNKLYKFVTNQFINRYDEDYSFNSVVPEKQKLISNFDFTKLILRDFIYNFWVINENMVKIVDLNRIIKNSRNYGSEYFTNLSRNDKITYKMFKFTCYFFHFLILYCKDNPKIKEELYENLDVFMYFIHISESCVNCLMEIFYQNSYILYYLIRDCKNKFSFQKALSNIYQTYFKHKVFSPDFNFIDLLFEFIKISNTEKYAYNAEDQDEVNKVTISVISREKYFRLLKILSHINTNENILENQKYIANLILTKPTSINDEIRIQDYLIFDNEENYSPALIELILKLAENNNDHNIEKFVSQTLINYINFNEKLIDININPINIQLISYYIKVYSESKEKDKLKYQSFITNVNAHFHENIQMLNKFFSNYDWINLKLNENDQVNVVAKMIEFIRHIYNYKVSNNFSMISEDNKVIINSLIKYLTKSFFLYQDYFSSFKSDEEMNKKINILEERINNKPNSHYLIIAKYWQNIYLIFKNNFSSMLFDKYIKDEVKKKASMLDSSFRKDITEVKDRKINIFSDLIKAYGRIKEFRDQTIQVTNNSKIQNSTEKIVTNEDSEFESFIENIGKLNQVALEMDRIKLDNAKTVLENNRDKIENNFRQAIIFGQSRLDSDRLKLENGSIQLAPNEEIVNTKNERPLLNGLVGLNGVDFDNLEKNLDTQQNLLSERDNEPHHEDDIVVIHDTIPNKTSKIRNKSQHSYYSPKRNIFEVDKPENFQTIELEEHRDQPEIQEGVVVSEPKFTVIKNSFAKVDRLIGGDEDLQDNEFKFKNINITLQILEFFKLLISKNIDFLIHNFSQYYFEINNQIYNDKDYVFKKFKLSCIPKLDSTELIPYIEEFSSSYEQDLKSKNDSNFATNLFNLNNILTNDSPENHHEINELNVCFIHRLMILFNISNDNETELNILNLIYKFFSQRKKLLTKIMHMNENVLNFHKSTRDNPERLFSDNFDTIKDNFNEFLTWYEKDKNMFSEIFVDQTYNYYSTLYIKLNILLKKIFNNVKRDITQLSLEENKKSLDNESVTKDFFETLSNDNQLLINKTNEIIALITEGEENQEMSITHNQISKIFNFIRENSDNQIFSSISSYIVKDTFSSNDFSLLLRDHLDKGLRLMKKFSNKIEINGRLTDIEESTKKKYFFCFCLLIIVWTLTRKVSTESFNFLSNILEKYHDLIKHDAFVSFIILLNLSDMNNKMASLSYYYVISTLVSFSNILPATYRNLHTSFSKELQFFFLEILSNVLGFIIQGGVMIQESNIDELIIESLFVFLKKVRIDDYINKEILLKITKVLQKIFSVKILIKHFNFKLSYDPSLVDKLPNPSLYVDFFKKSYENSNLKEIKRNIFIIKYMISYIFEINPYFITHINDNDDLLWLKDLISPLLDNLKIQDLLKYSSTVLNILSSKRSLETVPDEREEIRPSEPREIYRIDNKTSLFYIFMIYNSIYSKSRENFKELSLTYLEEFKNYIIDYLISHHSDLSDYTYNGILQVAYITKKIDKFLKLRKKSEFKEDYEKNEVELRVKNLNEIIKNRLLEFKNLKKNRFEDFKDILWDNRTELEELGNSEAECFVYYLIMLLEKKQSTKEYDMNENILLKFLYKVVDFIYKSSLNFSSYQVVKINNFLLSMFSKFVSFFDRMEEKEVDLIKLTRSKLFDIQELIERTGIVEKFLLIISHYKNNSDIIFELPFVFDVFCFILKKGNENVQRSFYNSFTSNSDNEQVFKFLYELIQEKMDNILTNRNYIIISNHSKMFVDNQNFEFVHETSKELDTIALKFLQLLCENHNDLLQNYLRYQPNFKKGYDLVSATNNYLHVLFSNYDKSDTNMIVSLIRCFDLLIEFVQGPCLNNQKLLINSKLLISICDILQRYKDIDLDNYKTFNQNNLLFTYPQISLLTYKCSILLLALVEARTKDDDIYDQIASNIKNDLFTHVIEKIYTQINILSEDSKDRGKNLLRLSDLNHSERIFDLVVEVNTSSNISENEIHENNIDIDNFTILETGFNLYFLTRYINEYYQYNRISYNEVIKKKAFDVHEYFEELSSEGGTQQRKLLITGLLKHIYKLTCMKSDIIKGTVIYDAVEYFKFYTRSIEISRKERVYKIYFYLMPFRGNYKEIKKYFNENMIITNKKAKLIYLLRYSKLLIHELDSDYRLRRFLDNFPFFGVLLDYVTLWRDFSLLVNIVQNVLIIIEQVRIVQNGQLINTYDSFADVDEIALTTGLGIVQVVLTSIIFIEYVTKKFPSRFKAIQEKIRDDAKYQVYKKSTKNCFLFCRFVKSIMLNSEMFYWIIYIIFAFLGLLKDTIFFAVLLIEFIARFKTMKTIMNSVWDKIKEILLTLALWIILIYWATLIAYVYLYEYFPNKDIDCLSLINCFCTIFYQNNKNDDGIPTYFNKQNIDSDPTHNPITGRYIYDVLFTLIIKIIVIQMVGGIIIDNFAKLRNEESDMNYELTNVCTICGLNRDEIEKIYDKFGKTYNDHINNDHDPFNYIFYLFYIKKKDHTEFTGMESFVYNMAFVEKDITWFPENMLYIAKSEDFANMISNNK